MSMNLFKKQIQQGSLQVHSLLDIWKCVWKIKSDAMRVVRLMNVCQTVKKKIDEEKLEKKLLL